MAATSDLAVCSRDSARPIAESALAVVFSVFWRWAERRQIDTANYPAWSAKAARAFARPSVVRALRKEVAPVLA